MKIDYDQVGSQVHELLVGASNLAFGDTITLHGLVHRIEMVIVNVYGSDSAFVSDLRQIVFQMDSCAYQGRESLEREWEPCRGKLETLCKVILQDFQRTSFQALAESAGPAIEARAINSNNDVFIVHGHDELMKVEVARTLERLGLTPIILHEKPDEGRTVIEKFEHHSNVGFAVVLLSPDDKGYSVKCAPENAKSRARQNVVLELGFFVGKLGRKRVVALHRVVEGFEMPSDYGGVL
jgi:hypothetical protein